MVKKNSKKKITIFGSGSIIASSINQINFQDYEITNISRKKNNLKNNLVFKDLINKAVINNKKLDNIIKLTDIFIILLGTFHEKDPLKMLKVNLLFYDLLFKKIIESNRSNKKIVKVICVSSLDSIIPNINVPIYSASKAGLSQLIKCYKKKYKTKKINFYDLAPGAINTKMRRYKKDNNIIQPKQIALIIKFLIESDINYEIDRLVIYPKTKTYEIY